MVITNNSTIQRILLVIVDDGCKDMEYCIKEMSQLVKTANSQVIGAISQKRDKINNATIVGIGKLQEIKEYAIQNDIDVIIFDSNLTATHRRNIRQIIDLQDVDILDKTDLILDIFALHANSAEGKQQVELAQLQYSLATKSQGDYSRQGAGIGTRGPGETKLETNKRAIRAKITALRQQLSELQQKRTIQQKSRIDNEVFTVALVGYTNAGKSTLFNGLVGENVLAEDKLFATLDTTTRRLVLDNGIEVLVVDTVGFIKDLHHTLIDAFKSTLSIVATADLVLHICDIAEEYLDEHIVVCQDIMQQLNVKGKIVRIFNKVDSIEEYNTHMYSQQNAILVSAKYKMGLDAIKTCILQEVNKKYTSIYISVSYEHQSNMFALLKKYATSYKIVYQQHSIEASVIVNNNYVEELREYIIL